MKSIFDENCLQEVKRYIKYDKPDYYFVFILILECGLNLGTIFNLTFDDIDEKTGNIIIIIKSQNRCKEYIVPNEISREFWDFSQKRKRLSIDDNHFLFCTNSGKRMHESKFSIYLTSIGEKLEIEDLNSRNLKKLYFERLDSQKNETEDNINCDITDLQIILNSMAKYNEISSQIISIILNSAEKMNVKRLDNVKQIYLQHLSELGHIKEMIE